LDADSLNAFIEGVLPEHERLQCLAHLADCSRCREIVFSAQEAPDVVAVPKAFPAPRRWFGLMPTLATAAIVCLAVAVSLYLSDRLGEQTSDVAASIPQLSSIPEHSAAAETQDQMASATTPQVVQVTPPPNSEQALGVPQSPAGEHFRAATGAAVVSSPAAEPKPATTPAPQEEVRSFERPGLSLPPPPMAPPSNIQSQQLPENHALLSSVAAPPPPASSSSDATPEVSSALTNSLSRLSGEVTDTSGAVIPGATVTLRDTTTGAKKDAQTDMRGQFELAGVVSGQYELQVNAPGFVQDTRQIDLQPQEMAKVSSTLEVGTVAQSVTVTGQVPLVETTTATVSSSARNERRNLPLANRSGTGLPPATVTASSTPLPSKLPAATTLVSGKSMVAFDSAGALFFSSNEGRRWRAVKPLWAGKVVRLAPAAPSQALIAAFQLTTDLNSMWLSRDGLHWFEAPPLP
jgi:hypothetical protein